MDLRVRRATLEDVGILTTLWKSMNFDTEQLARRITDFQLVESSDALLVGGLGLQITDKQGLVHSEAFTDFALAEDSRPLLWDRVQSLANNHGLLRLWTREDAPFWHRCGMTQPDAEALEKIPASWREEGTKGLLTLKLREDLDSIMSLDKELALYMQMERHKTSRAIQRAKAFKVTATALAFILMAIAISAAFFLLRKSPAFNFLSR